MAEMSRMAVTQYTPIVEEILRTRSRDVRHIEWTRLCLKTADVQTGPNCPVDRNMRNSRFAC
jgi:hypothetical protein